MQKIKLFPDTNAFLFSELEGYTTIVYTIERNNKLYIIDTFMGSDYMELILQDHNELLEYIIINTHFHYDHIFGNAAFENNKIYAHQKCYDLINETREVALNDYGKQLKGKQELLLPNHLFDQEVVFETDDIILQHTPGHSIDSISIYDRQNKAIYTGDNLEKPIIQICNVDRVTYSNTLQSYLSCKDYRYFASHTLELTRDDIQQMIDYLMNMEDYSFTDQTLNKIHTYNLELSSKK